MTVERPNRTPPTQAGQPGSPRPPRPSPLRQVGIGALCTAGLAAVLLLGMVLMAGLVAMTIVGIVLALGVAGAILQAALARSEDLKDRWRRT